MWTSSQIDHLDGEQRASAGGKHDHKPVVRVGDLLNGWDAGTFTVSSYTLAAK